jgi:hypothetical protein
MTCQAFLSAVCLSLFAMRAVAGEEPKAAPGPLVLKVIDKAEKHVFDGGNRTPREFKEFLEELATRQKKGERIEPPEPFRVDFVLKVENTSKEPITVYVGGTANIFTLDLSGGSGVVTLTNPALMPRLVRAPSAVTIDPGKSYEVPVDSLSDGRRGTARLVYWTGPGEYKLTATYTLLDALGGKLEVLKSDPITVKVVEK